MGTVLQDLRYGLRTLRRDPGFTVVAVLMLALGIGATTLVFSVCDALLVHVFPYRDADRLTWFYIEELRQGGYKGPMSPSVPQYLELRKSFHSFEDVIGFWNNNLEYDNGQGVQWVPAAAVTTNTFAFLGVDPLMGRPILPEDDTPAAPPVCVVSYRFWQEQIHGDPGVLGTAVKLNGEPRTVVGVMPPRFQFLGASLWTPFRLNASSGRSYVEMMARLRPEAGMAEAEADVAESFQRLEADWPASFGNRHYLTSLRTLTDVAVGDFRRVLYTLLGAAAMLLLIGCSNVANLLLVRATRREREMAIRVAVGANRTRLLRQLLVESTILAVAGAAVGGLLTFDGLNAFAAMLPHGVVPDEAVIGLNRSVLWFALAMAAATTFFCGLIPAIQTSRREVRTSLASASRGAVRGALVIAEVALSIVLLAGAGLMTRTLFALTHVSLGFNPENLLFTQLSVPRGRYGTPEQQRELMRRVVDQVRQMPGVAGATFALGTPPGGARGLLLDFGIPGKPQTARWSTSIAVSGEGYLRLLGRPLRRGRDFSQADVDSARRLAIVNETFVRSFLGTADPIGQTIRFDWGNLRGAPADPNFEIVGVVADARNRGLREPIFPEALLVYSALPNQGLGILVKTETPPLSLVESLRRQVWTVDPGLVLVRTQAVEDYIRESYDQPRFGLVAISSFAAVGLVLAIIGVFSVMAYAVSVQTREIGIRMALGAQQSEIVKMVLRKGLVLVGGGVAIGLAATVALTRLIASQLWGVSPNDPWTLLAVTVLLSACSLAACWLPARRAANVDPMIALREE